jgi:hypothetical protein
MDDEKMVQTEAIKTINAEPICSSVNFGYAGGSTSAGPAIGIPAWLIAGGIGLALGLILGGD